jgi:nucleoside-diphosphate-sugar epimerase
MSNPNELHVIFGAGPVGRAVMSELVPKGKRVRIVSRSGKIDAPSEVEVAAGDATDPAATHALCAGASVVYNCTNAAYTAWPEQFPPLQAGVMGGAAAAGAKLVVMENLYMYGPTAGRPLTEDLPYAATTRKGRTRARMAEELLAAHANGKVRVAIGRASDFFGPNVRDSAVGERVFASALAGKAAQIIGNPDLPHTYSYVPDIGKGLVLLGEHEQALGQAWHLPSAPAVSTRAFVELVYKAAGCPPRLQALPGLVVRGLGLVMPMMRELAEMLYEFEEPHVVDHSRFAQAFGDHATPLSEAIRTTLAWYQEQAEASKRVSKQAPV